MKNNLKDNEEKFIKIMKEYDYILNRNDLKYKRNNNELDGDYIRQAVIDWMYDENLLSILQKEYNINDEEIAYYFDISMRITGDMVKRYVKNDKR